MEVVLVDGEYLIDAPWLDEPVSAPTFEEAYEAAMRGKRRTS